MLKTNCGNMCRRQATPFSGSPSAFKLTLIMDWCRKHGFLTSYGCIGLHIPCHIPVNSYCTEEPSTLMEDVDDSLIQSNFNGSNTFGTMTICSRLG